MSYRIFFNEKEGIVQVVYSGTAAKEDHYAALNSAIQLCSEKSTTKLLVDFQELHSSNLSTMDIFLFGEFVAKTKQIFHIAHVFAKRAQARENIRFASNVEANRGKTTRDFTDAEEAIDWLRSL